MFLTLVVLVQAKARGSFQAVLAPTARVVGSPDLVAICVHYMSDLEIIYRHPKNQSILIYAQHKLDIGTHVSTGSWTTTVFCDREIVDP